MEITNAKVICFLDVEITEYNLFINLNSDRTKLLRALTEVLFLRDKEDFFEQTTVSLLKVTCPGAITFKNTN